MISAKNPRVEGSKSEAEEEAREETGKWVMLDKAKQERARELVAGAVFPRVGDGRPSRVSFFPRVHGYPRGDRVPVPRPIKTEESVYSIRIVLDMLRMRKYCAPNSAATRAPASAIFDANTGGSRVLT